MKKFKFVFVLVAAFISVSTISCSNKSADKDEDKDTKKESSPKAKANSQNFASEDVDFESTMDYLEANAPSFFSELNGVIAPVDKVINGIEPTDEESALLENFINENQTYFEVIGMVLTFESQTELTAEQSARLEAFSNRYNEGLTNLGKLIGLGIAAQEM